MTLQEEAVFSSDGFRERKGEYPLSWCDHAHKVFSPDGFRERKGEYPLSWCDHAHKVFSPDGFRERKEVIMRYRKEQKVSLQRRFTLSKKGLCIRSSGGHLWK